VKCKFEEKPAMAQAFNLRSDGVADIEELDTVIQVKIQRIGELGVG
jgi:hypothetical protein